MVIATTVTPVVQAAHDAAVAERVPKVAVGRMEDTPSVTRLVRLRDMVTLLLTRQLVLMGRVAMTTLAFLAAQEVGAAQVTPGTTVKE